MTTLLQLVQQVPDHVQQSIIIYFKNRIKKGWTKDIGPNDKIQVKQQLLMVMVSLNQKSR